MTSPADSTENTKHVADVLSGSVVMGSPDTVRVSWTAEHRLYVQVVPEGAGSVSRDPSGEWYAAGAAVSLIASPAEGYRFGGWIGDLTYPISSTTISMDGPKRVTATFVGVPVISVSPSSLDLGSALVGKSGELTLEVRNTGTAALQVADIASNDAVFSASPGSFVVSAGGTQPVVVRFTPKEDGLPAWIKHFL